MGIFDFFRKREAQEEQIVNEDSVGGMLLRSIRSKDVVTRDSVMNIPGVAACVNKIADTVASLPIKLYRRENDSIVELENDPRVYLLNGDTGDTMDGSQFKKEMVMDMYLDKGGYAYINRSGNEVVSIHHVEPRYVSYWRNSNAIFKDYRIQVQGVLYEGWQFIKLLRNTKNGFEGKSIIEDRQLLLSTVYGSLEYERNLVKTGGNKKGFIKSLARLSNEAKENLKAAFRNLYSNNTENVVILNEGLDFKESSNTSVEIQLNENKKTNNDDICKVFLIPPAIINGGATEEDHKIFYENCIMPILDRFAAALNSSLLLEDEKPSLFFAFDATELTKGDILKRYQAYEIGIRNGFIQTDEARRKENYPAFGFKFIKLGLQDVLYDPDTEMIYTPNTNKLSKMGETITVEPQTIPPDPGSEDQGDKGGEKGDES